MRPAFITATRSDITRASSWSWVTKMAVIGEADEGEDAGDRRVDLGPWRPARLEAERDVVGHGQVGKQRIALEHDADVALVGGHAGEVGAVEPHPAAVGGQEPGDDAEQRRLATAGRPEQRDELTGADLEVQALDDRGLAEPLRDVDDVEVSGSARHQTLISLSQRS